MRSGIMTSSANEDLKVGRYIKYYLHNFFNRIMIPDELLYKLQDKDYSKEMIGLNYPLLVRIEPGEDYREKITISGSSRYWTDTLIKINGGYYYICNDWYEGEKRNNRIKFNQWIKAIEDQLKNN